MDSRERVKLISPFFLTKNNLHKTKKILHLLKH